MPLADRPSWPDKVWGMILGAADGGWGVTIRVVIILSVLFAGMVLVAITGGWTITGFVDFLH
jgi:hypothetical protein